MKKIFVTVLLVMFSLNAKEITIKSEDGFILKGWIDFPKKKQNVYPLAFLVHQFGSDHTKWIEFAKELRKRGYATLMVDLRGHGASVKQRSSINKIVPFTSLADLKKSIEKSSKKVNFQKIPSDLSLWLDTVEGGYKNIDIQNLSFFGASLGAAGLISIMFDYEPKIAVLFSPGSTEELGAEDSIGDIAIPLMFVSSAKDFALERTLNYTKEASTPTTLILPGNGHGEALFDLSKNYVSLFLDKYGAR